MPDREQLHWFTSSFSGGSGNECVQCARTSGSMVVRDSKAPEGNVATFGARPWGDFLLSLRDPGHRGPLGVS
ncbi:DUF397 domain-containing protein [Streptomyces sp. NPDC102364]|uniref:DUF397 domain-containing protein n=1 Tax=Streptomyces sp. NPDC102364 TaxID=3366161 RepID=UPI00382C096B